MNKMNLVHRLREARRAHTQWLSRARGLISGLVLEKESVPLMPTDCVFGAWYYGDGRALAQLESFGRIEEPHNQLHDVYMQIFKLLFTESKPSFFSKLLGQASAGVSEEDLQQAKALLTDLEQISKVIVGHIEDLENEIMDMLDDEYDQLVGSRVA